MAAGGKSYKPRITCYTAIDRISISCRHCRQIVCYDYSVEYRQRELSNHSPAAGAFTLTKMGRTFFADWFYKSPPWMAVRNAYLAQRIKVDGGMCECCGAVPGVEVHHKIHLTPVNIHDPQIALNPDNLILLCFKCHRRQHRHKFAYEKKERYSFDEFGNVIPPGRR